MLACVGDSRTRLPATVEAEMIAAQTTVGDWLQLIRAEYLEMPGLCLTHDQARRLWGLDDITCNALLASLVDGGFLRVTASGLFVRADTSR
jgi:hypothetical protein